MWGDILFEPIYKLDKHLEDKSNRYVSQSVVKLLFSEVGTRCPKCDRPLKWGLCDYLETENDIDTKVNFNSPNSSDNQIAHIYGRNLFAQNNMPLYKKYHINSVSDLDTYKNLIILCSDCHSKYDNHIRTYHDDSSYDKYLEILEMKKTINSKIIIEDYLCLIFQDFRVDFEKYYDKINLVDLDYKSEINKTKLKRKLDYNGISNSKQRDIVNNNIAYFDLIRNMLENMDNSESFVKHFNQTYRNLKTRHSNNNEIINEYKNIFSDDYLTKAVEIIVSHMIMICEVLENVTE